MANVRSSLLSFSVSVSLSLSLSLSFLDSISSNLFPSGGGNGCNQRRHCHPSERASERCTEGDGAR